MFTTLVPSHAVPAEPRAWGARSLSLGLHAGLIALAVWSTQRARPASAPGRDPGFVLTFVPHAARTPAPRLPAAPSLPGVATAVPLVVPSVPPVGIPAPAPTWVEPSFAAPGAPGVVEPAGPPSPPPTAPLDVRVVEEPPVLLWHPAPGYPELLRRAGIEGRVTVEVVLDTLGRPERGSLRVIESTHALFVPEAMALVRDSRYAPARFGGRPVRVRIRAPVVFALRR